MGSQVDNTTVNYGGGGNSASATVAAYNAMARTLGNIIPSPQDNQKNQMALMEMLSRQEDRKYNRERMAQQDKLALARQKLMDKRYTQERQDKINAANDAIKMQIANAYGDSAISGVEGFTVEQENDKTTERNVFTGSEFDQENKKEAMPMLPTYEKEVVTKDELDKLKKYDDVMKRTDISALEKEKLIRSYIPGILNKEEDDGLDKINKYLHQGVNSVGELMGDLADATVGQFRTRGEQIEHGLAREAGTKRRDKEWAVSDPYSEYSSEINKIREKLAKNKISKQEYDAKADKIYKKQLEWVDKHASKEYDKKDVKKFKDAQDFMKSLNLAKQVAESNIDKNLNPKEQLLEKLRIASAYKQRLAQYQTNSGNRIKLKEEMAKETRKKNSDKEVAKFKAELKANNEALKMIAKENSQKAKLERIKLKKQNLKLDQEIAKLKKDA